MSEPIDNGAGGNSVFTRKLGAFPLWVWMGLGLAGLLIITDYSKNKKAAQQSQQTTLPTTQTASGSEPASLIPQFVNQVYENPTPPVVNVSQNVQGVTGPQGPPGPTGPAGPTGPTGPTSTPTAPAPTTNNQIWVTVSKWTPGNAPWNSTLWGIAQHYWGDGNLWPYIANANKQGVMRPDGTPGTITNPNLIYPGERIYLPSPNPKLDEPASQGVWSGS